MSLARSRIRLYASILSSSLSNSPRAQLHTVEEQAPRLLVTLACVAAVSARQHHLLHPLTAWVAAVSAR